jgi:hypothetical protein
VRVLGVRDRQKKGGSRRQFPAGKSLNLQGKATKVYGFWMKSNKNIYLLM